METRNEKKNNNNSSGGGKGDYQPLKPGDKYYTIEVNLGALGKHKFALFQNPDWAHEDKRARGVPFAKSREGAMWINEKKDAEASKAFSPEEVLL